MKSEQKILNDLNKNWVLEFGSGLCIEKLNLKNFCNHVVVTHIPGLRSLEVHFKEGHNITNHNFVERLAIYNANYIERENCI